MVALAPLLYGNIYKNVQLRVSCSDASMWGRGVMVASASEAAIRESAMDPVSFVQKLNWCTIASRPWTLDGIFPGSLHINVLELIACLNYFRAVACRKGFSPQRNI